MDKVLKNLTESWHLLIDKIFSWIDSIVLTLPNILLVLIALFIGRRLIGFANRIVKRLAEKHLPNNGVQNLTKNVASVVFYMTLALVILTILGLQGTITTVLASAGVAGLALGLALQDPLMNLFSGIIMSVKHVFDVGDTIESNGFLGRVQEISLKSTVIKILSGEEVNIPNKLVLQSPVKNYTINGLRRIEIECGISYGDNLEKVKEVATNSVWPLAVTTMERPVEFIYTSFGDSSINFQLRFWTNPIDVWQFQDVKSKAIIMMKKAFDENGITIPFPIRTLDFGIKGGLSLQKSLSKQSL